MLCQVCLYKEPNHRDLSMFLFTASAAAPSGSRLLLSVSPEVVQSFLQIGVCVSHGSLGLGLLPCCYRQASSGARKICNRHQLKWDMGNSNWQCDRKAVHVKKLLTWEFIRQSEAQLVQNLGHDGVAGCQPEKNSQKFIKIWCGGMFCLKI